MRYPDLNSYLSRLRAGKPGDDRLWADRDGRVQGQFFNCALTSQFQPVRSLAGQVLAFEAHAHSYSPEDRGLSVWRMLNNAASDDESIELDRLCRILHVLNFFRQEGDAQGSSLLIGVHERLLAAISSNHGAVFRHILEGLSLPVPRIVLQLPQASADRNWAIGFVVDNYRRNGFRISTRARDTEEAHRHLEQLRPDLVRIDSHALSDAGQMANLIEHAAALDVQLLFSRVDAGSDLLHIIDALVASGSGVGEHLLFQGTHAGLPEPALAAASASGMPATPATGPSPSPVTPHPTAVAQSPDRKRASSLA